MAKKTAAKTAGKERRERRQRRELGQQRRARRAARQARTGEDIGYREKRQAEKTEAAGKKEGCAPKLGMLLLPFVAASIYLILRS